MTSTQPFQEDFGVNPESASNAIQQIGNLIRTQDNRGTSDPLFLVQQKIRIYGMDSDYCDDFEWVGEDGTELQKVYYIDIWEFVTVCFTEQACKDYIAANGHNLSEPRIYASSAYRNREMITIRDFLKSV